MHPELVRCPFCGVKPRVIAGNGVTIIACSNTTGKQICAARPRVYSMVTRDEPEKDTLNQAIELWNRRS